MAPVMHAATGAANSIHRLLMDIVLMGRHGRGTISIVAGRCGRATISIADVGIMIAAGQRNLPGALTEAGDTPGVPIIGAAGHNSPGAIIAPVIGNMPGEMGAEAILSLRGGITAGADRNLLGAIIGGETRSFSPLVNLYREAAKNAGHPPERLKVGMHSLGYVSKSTKEAQDDFFPGYAKSFSEIGRERGWPPVTRAHFDALLEPTGALIVGDPETVAEKILRVNESLGGISRSTFQVSVAALPHAKLMRAIELLGAHVAPLVREVLAPLTPRAPAGTSADLTA